ncbi:uncharacterized protein F5891DRAFT_985735 [Suillus fuscotomentosus]|uniref:Uncharacterized protein n=1 Tax=Suillus fuscotomentosus TaxID=1912939 RepID=A0AAD4DTN9_9AGAM|nr:uncharacterized protein F5891DRAFT_985735 [Suillus fuscotomentosus]KAG1893589.1 hypothetical protein F5891DRAFT_985735 [Suillus fuscotomentosus]
MTPGWQKVRAAGHFSPGKGPKDVGGDNLAQPWRRHQSEGSSSPPIHSIDPSSILVIFLHRTVMFGSLESRYIKLGIISGKNFKVPSGRIPADIYVSINPNSRRRWKSAISVLSSDESVAWEDTITLSSHASPVLSVEIRESYEHGRMLGSGEVIGKLQTLWDELLDHDDESFGSIPSLIWPDYFLVYAYQTFEATQLLHLTTDIFRDRLFDPGCGFIALLVDMLEHRLTEDPAIQILGQLASHIDVQTDLIQRGFIEKLVSLMKSRKHETSSGAILTMLSILRHPYIRLKAIEEGVAVTLINRLKHRKNCLLAAYAFSRILDFAATPAYYHVTPSNACI